MSRSILLLLPLVAACSAGAETIVAGNDDPQAKELAKAAPVTLPPAILATRTYRCADNSLLYADFYTNNTVSVRVGDRNAAPVTLAAADGGAAYVSDGYSVSANSETIDFKAPGKGGQNCNA
jgi:hypothetical protein